jgi:two-component system sensor histidine kinase AtoS
VLFRSHRLEDVIEFSRPVRPVLQPVALAEAVQRAASRLQEAIFKQGVELQVGIDDKLPVLMLDPEHVQTILLNLLGNAVDAMPAGGCLSVRAAYDSGTQTLELRFQDQGTGIPAEQLREIGKPFFSTKPGSIGLGLAITKRLLEAYQGDLRIESQVGQGTLVIGRLRAKPGEAASWAA